MCAFALLDRKGVVQGKGVDLGGRRIIKKNQCAVPPGTLVNVAPRFKRLVRSAGVASTPVADPVAPCAAPSEAPVKLFTVMCAFALLMVNLAAPLAEL